MSAARSAPKKLTYWIADRIDDAHCYSIRERTRKKCAAALATWGDDWGRHFGRPRKVVVRRDDMSTWLHIDNLYVPKGDPHA